VVVISLTFAALVCSPFDSRSPKTPGEVTLVYVGAQDCAPCRAWQRGDGAAFLTSAEFARLSYREVKAPTLLDVLNDDFWPEDLRVYREVIGRGAGVPLWLVIADNKMVAQGFGATQWSGSVLPMIKSLLH
jgi:hypothetical protein